MIRNKYLKQIHETIKSNDRFELTDFLIDVGQQGYSGTDVAITYLLNPTFQFHVTIPKETSTEGTRTVYKFSGSFCPGLVSFKEDFSFSGTEGLFKRIENWLTYIWEELTTDPIMREIDKQREDINKIFDKINSVDDTNFKKEEINDLNKRLSDLEASFHEELKKVIEDKGELTKELNDLKKDFETLKVTLKTLKKTGWARGFVSKIFKWTTKHENRTLLKDGYKIVKELLPDNIGKSLPELPE